MEQATKQHLFVHLTSLGPSPSLSILLDLFLLALDKFLFALCEYKVNNEGYLARPRARFKFLSDYPGRYSVPLKKYPSIDPIYSEQYERETGKTTTGDKRLMSCALL